MILGPDSLQSGPSWQTIALISVGAIEVLAMFLVRRAAQDLRELQQRQVSQGESLIQLQTHVGTEGNGLIARFDALTHEMRELTTMVHTLSVQLARAEGSR